MSIHCEGADPGFPRGTPNQKGERETIFQLNFPENCMKMKNF